MAPILPQCQHDQRGHDPIGVLDNSGSRTRTVARRRRNGLQHDGFRCLTVVQPRMSRGVLTQRPRIRLTRRGQLRQTGRHDDRPEPHQHRQLRHGLRRAPAVRARPPVDALHPDVVLRRTPTSRSSSGARAPTSTTPRASATSTRWPACSSASSATAAPSSPRRRAKQTEELAFIPLWSYAHPNAIELAQRIARYAPGDLNRVFFTSGGGEAVETAWKLAKQYFKLTGKPSKHKVISPRDRLPRHDPGRPVDHRPARA